MVARLETGTPASAEGSEGRAHGTKMLEDQAEKATNQESHRRGAERTEEGV